MTFKEANENAWKKGRAINIAVFGIGTYEPICKRCDNFKECVMSFNVVQECKFYKEVKS